MKKLLLLSLSFVAFIGFAQTIEVLNQEGDDMNGTTVSYVFDEKNSSGNYKGDVRVEIKNIGSTDIEFQVKRTNKSIECGGYAPPFGHQMCLGTQCYISDIIPSASDTKTLPSGETMELHMQIEFDSLGKTTEFYEIYEYNNDNNKVSFTANYKSVVPCLADAVDNINNSNLIIKTYPNPANNIINFNYVINADAYITIHDITGKQVGKVDLNNNKTHATFLTENLQSGIYFYNVYVNDIKTKTDKFIVRH